MLLLTPLHFSLGDKIAHASLVATQKLRKLALQLFVSLCPRDVLSLNLYLCVLKLWVHLCLQIFVDL